MNPEYFFSLFLDELKGLPELSSYYKFHKSAESFEFRKAYFMQRLQYIDEQVRNFRQNKQADLSIWDCGCGYGTTCLYLAMNGIKTYGSTLEFYFAFIEKRKKYWSAYGDSSLFTAGYEDIYEQHPAPNSVDLIIVQDTLHHLEPIDEAISMFHEILIPGGEIICVEENGHNVIQNLKLYKQRGNKRIISYWDESLKKQITMGNENIRGLDAWEALFAKQNLTLIPERTKYIRLLFPFLYKNRKANEVAAWEDRQAFPILRKYFFFGINFIVRKEISIP